MSPIALCLNLLLAGLLLLALWFGWRLEQRLKALKDGHEGFAKAVAELDRAAARAERGLAELRAAGDETLELLSSRIEKGRELAAKLDRLNTGAAAVFERAPSARISELERVWAQPGAKPAPESAHNPAMDPSRLALADAEAAAEALVLKLSKAEALDEAPSLPPPSPRSKAMIDDDLFETPVRAAPRALTGGR